MSLGICLLLTACSCSALPLGAPFPANDQGVEEAILWVERLGGTVYRDETDALRPVIAVEVGLGDGDRNAEGLRRLDRFKALRRLKLTGPGVSDGHLEAIGKLACLESFEAFQTEVTAAGVRSLGNLDNLRELRLVLCPSVTDEALQGLRRLRRLEQLSLYSTKVTGKGFGLLECKKVLKDLDVRRSRFSDGNLEELKAFTRLERLDLGSNYQVTAAGVKHLGSLGRLRQIALDGTQVSSDGVLALRNARPGIVVDR